MVSDSSQPVFFTVYAAWSAKVLLKGVGEGKLKALLGWPPAPCPEVVVYAHQRVLGTGFAFNFLVSTRGETL
jgi:hypothetical protein